MGVKSLSTLFSKTEYPELHKGTRWKLLAASMLVPYLKSADVGARARRLVACNLGLSLVQRGIGIGKVMWYGALMDSLVSVNQERFMMLSLLWPAIAGSTVTASRLNLSMGQDLKVHWRDWGTKRFIDRWLGNDDTRQARPYHQIEMTRPDIGNIDQRISDDYRIATEKGVDLGTGMFNSGVTALGYTALLMFAVSPYMGAAALSYAIAGVGLTVLAGKKLVRQTNSQRDWEAGFRRHLASVRENVDGIAGSKSESWEKHALSGKFNVVADGMRALNRTIRNLATANMGYQEAAQILPLMVSAPLVFSERITVGDVMQAYLAFHEIQAAMTFFMGIYPQIADGKASADRIYGGDRAISEVVAATEAARTAQSNPSGIRAVRRLGPQPGGQ